MADTSKPIVVSMSKLIDETYRDDILQSVIKLVNTNKWKHVTHKLLQSVKNINFVMNLLLQMMACYEFASWLDAVADDVYMTYCRTCKKTFDVGNMGVAAVKSHMKSKTHASISGSAGSYTHAIKSLVSTHRVSHRGVQTQAAAHCHKHRIRPLILLLSLVTSSEQRNCGH